MRVRGMGWVMAAWVALAPFSSVAAGLTGSALLEHLARTYTSPQDVARLLQTEFTFESDTALFGETDRWQSPEEFLARRAGDCEDYALLARELLRRNWIDADVLSLFGPNGYAHTVCVFKDVHGLFNLIDQDTLYAVRAPTLDALASRVNPNWTLGGIVEREGTHGRFVRSLMNPRAQGQ